MPHYRRRRAAREGGQRKARTEKLDAGFCELRLTPPFECHLQLFAAIDPLRGTILSLFRGSRRPRAHRHI
jgi:hypothetical protein